MDGPVGVGARQYSMIYMDDAVDSLHVPDVLKVRKAEGE